MRGPFFTVASPSRKSTWAADMGSFCLKLRMKHVSTVELQDCPWNLWDCLRLFPLRIARMDRMRQWEVGGGFLFKCISPDLNVMAVARENYIVKRHSSRLRHKHGGPSAYMTSFLLIT